jgi:glycosyltransferase involved in cell wall biosynthesis
MVPILGRDNEPVKLVVHWPRFGPYHIARLEAAFHKLKRFGVTIIGMETAGQDNTYQWRRESGPTDFQRHTVFPNRVYETIPPWEMFGRFWSLLDTLDPAAVAITGYNSVDARWLLLWCCVHNRPAILMSASKRDDAPRVWWKEWAKSLIVRRYSAAICGGSAQRAYLESLGLSLNRIFLGYNAVDNSYFEVRSEEARKFPWRFQDLPGVGGEAPYFLASARFVERKNLAGLLMAYDRYCSTLRSTGCGNPWRLVILGDGEERTALEDVIRRRKLEGVTLAGFRQIDELPAYYGLAGAFVHPPFQEQWGLVVNEAMASGLPVLVSKTCGCASELICSGENGFRFDPSDLDELASLMRLISSDTVDVSWMGYRSQEIISDWGLDRFAQGLFQALEASLEASQIVGRK